MELKPGEEPPLCPSFWRRVLNALFALLQTRANGHVRQAKSQTPEKRGNTNE